ncbi:fibulin-2 isoform X2 [Trichosurus vulpecula]|uniref:fibulin-2 isoform X2 n=1 Tax=Trichosurus vulpecula TaxID=9337 RepID=UPI00186B33F8|nr:fibulin-2 isoform X2 [Trichosurus vulpecula]
MALPRGLPWYCLSGITLLLLLSRGSGAQKDCTGVDCKPLENCIEEVLEPGECCASCLQHGCTCEGYQYYDCVNVGFMNGKVPEGQSYFVDFGSTECSCPKGGGKISCQFMLCPDLPPNCIDAVIPSDGCPQCGRIGCLHEGQKYVAGHTVRMPHCKVCHCPNSGGELICYQLPGCDASAFHSGNLSEPEDNDPERHYDDPYSYDQEASEGDAAQVEAPTKGWMVPGAQPVPDPGSLEQLELQREDTNAIANNTTLPGFTQLVSPTRQAAAVAMDPKIPGQSRTRSVMEQKEEEVIDEEEEEEIEEEEERGEDDGYPEPSKVHKANEKATGAGSIQEKPEERQNSNNAVESEERAQERGEEHGRAEPEGNTIPNVQPNPRDRGRDGEKSVSIGFQAPTSTERNVPQLAQGGRVEKTIPKVKFTPTTLPPVALQEDPTEETPKQSQTLYRYTSQEKVDPNSIHSDPRSQEGSTKDLIETCCAAGQQWAIDNAECTEIPVSGADGDVCRIAQKQCCISYLKENSCVAGMVGAKEGEVCGPEENDTCGVSLYKQCCDCCNLGLKVKSEGQMCESNPNLGYPCNHVMLSCCEGEDHLIMPEVRKPPEPLPTVMPEKVSETENLHEALSISQESELSNSLPGDDRDECLLYPGELCQHLCINTVGSYKCACFPRFTLQEDGLSCLPDSEVMKPSTRGEGPLAPEAPHSQPEVVRLPQPVPNTCKDNGPCKQVCNVIENRAMCSCFPGYAIMADGVSCEDIDECAQGTHSCKVNFVCQNTQGSFYCESKQRCMDGFLQDPEGNCVDINECTSLPEPCKPGFNCINTVGSYTCQRNQLLCTRGYHSSEDGSKCVDVDECETGVHRCGEGQVCHNLPGTYRCDCKMGYQYDAFSRSCVDVNECWSYPGRLCQQACENTPGSYRCSCSSGFQLAFDGKHCEDVNECENNPCSQECANVYGSYQCYCRQGYQLAEDGHACKDIDECTQSAGILCTFRCLNVPGSYQCACPEQGYTMMANGRTCRDLDECALGTHNCSAAETCYNIQGSFRCLLFECPPNYRKVSDMRCERTSCFNFLDCQNTPVRITYYQLNFQTNIVVPAHIFRIGPSPAYTGDNIILTITKGNEENYFSAQKINPYTGVVFIQRPVKEPQDFLLDVEMKLWRQGTYTTFLAKIYIFITAHAF